MKALKIITAAILFIFSATMKSQVSVNVNIGSPPLWGPVGYSETRYYYLPDVEAYYDVQSSMFVYYGGGVWIRRAYLPDRYRNYDLYNGYKVVITDYRGNDPYIHFHNHKIKYKKGYRGGPQKTIGERPMKTNAPRKTNAGNQQNKQKESSNKRQGDNGNNKGGGHDKGGGKGKKK